MQGFTGSEGLPGNKGSKGETGSVGPRVSDLSISIKYTYKISNKNRDCFKFGYRN